MHVKLMRQSSIQREVQLISALAVLTLEEWTPGEANPWPIDTLEWLGYSSPHWAQMALCLLNH